jgi:hypothetical protein
MLLELQAHAGYFIGQKLQGNEIGVKLRWPYT